VARLCRVPVEILPSLLCDSDGVTVVISSLGSLFLRIRMDNFQCELQDDFATGETSSRQRVQRIERERDNRALAVFR
jgi:hypothetical protein